MLGFVTHKQIVKGNIEGKVKTNVRKSIRIGEIYFDLGISFLFFNWVRLQFLTCALLHII